MEQQSGQAALRQLLKSKAPGGYQSEPIGAGSLASYVPEKLSLPRGQGKPVDLKTILPPREKRQLENFKTEMLLSPEEMAGVQERGFHGDCYLDPQLQHNPDLYHRFVADLEMSNLLAYTTTPRVQIGAFMVNKKNNKQRLVIDARRANRLFRSPPTTVLGSVEAWSRLEVQDHQDVFMAQEDVKDFFYRLSIDRDLSEFFCLPAIDPHKLKSILGYLPPELQELQDRFLGPFYPMMAVLPMGFNWAFHLAHQAHVELARRSLPEAGHLRDRHPAPRIGAGPGYVEHGMLIYADNNNHLGYSMDKVAEVQKTMIDALHEHGLDTHDIQESAALAESLGARIDGLGGSVGPTPTRDWRLDRALWALTTRSVIDGEQLQVVVGHMTVRALLHRGLMGILRHAYIFIEESYNKRVRLWPSVAEEMRVFRSLMHLAVGDFKAPWDPLVMCTDASLSGYAVLEQQAGAMQSSAIGRWDERWRFRREDGSRVAPREVALESKDVFTDVATVLPLVDGEVFGDIEIDVDFPDVPSQTLQPHLWRLLWNAPIYYREPIHIIEARSVLGAIRHACKDVRRHGHRLTVLNDNMGVVLAVQKGRCHKYQLLRVIRRIAAYCLAAGIRCSLRWVPSERNVADKASRVWEETRGDTTANRKQGIQEEESRSVQSERGEKGQRQIDQPCSGREIVARKEPLPLKVEEDRREEAVREGLALDGPVVKGADGARQGATEEVWEAAEGVQGRDELAGDEQHQRASKEGLLQEARRVLRLHCKNQT